MRSSADGFSPTRCVPFTSHGWCISVCSSRHCRHAPRLPYVTGLLRMALYLRAHARGAPTGPSGGSADLCSPPSPSPVHAHSDLEPRALLPCRTRCERPARSTHGATVTIARDCCSRYSMPVVHVPQCFLWLSSERCVHALLRCFSFQRPPRSTHGSAPDAPAREHAEEQLGAFAARTGVCRVSDFALPLSLVCMLVKVGMRCMAMVVLG